MIRKIALCLILLMSPGLADELSTAVSADNQTMQAALADAQQTLPQFLANAVPDGRNAIADALLKVDFRLTAADAALAGGITSEVMWIEPFSMTGPTQFKGILINTPDFITDMQRGDKVAFTLSQIRDWAWYASDGTTYGQYTTRALLVIDGSAAALEQLAAFPADPVPADWR
jgi:uncharacterized protein YegJ (DUF2314 family)